MAEESRGTVPLPQRLRQRAVLGEDKGAAPLHYGWPADEQDALERGAGFTYMGPIGLVRVSGPDRLSWLTTLSSQVLTGLRPGDSTEGLFLDPQGRVTFQFGALDDGDSTWLLTELAFAAELTRFLDSMRFMLRVKVCDDSAAYRAVVTVNQAPEEATPIISWLGRHGGVAWVDPWPGTTPGGARYFMGDHPGTHARFRVYVCPAAEVDNFVGLLLRDSAAPNTTGAKGDGELVRAERPLQPVGTLALNAVRVAAWRPLRGSEVDARTLPAEVDWLRTAVHVDKGCYCGQESVARIINLGKPPRRLVFLQLDGSAENLPAPGASVELNGRQVGVVTSVARHWEMGPIALALVKRNLDPSAPLTIDGVDAAQEVIVPVEGRSDHAPADRPGAGLKRLPTEHRDLRTRGPGAGG